MDVYFESNKQLCAVRRRFMLSFREIASSDRIIFAALLQALSRAFDEDDAIDALFQRQQVQPDPVEQDVFDTFTTRVIEKDDINESCSVCIENYALGEQSVTLPCSHRFHFECAKTWLLEHQSTCPICRTSLKRPCAKDDAQGSDDAEIGNAVKKQRRR